ncbi:MAG: mechanosensitive ion channel domain-containing protein [Microbacterium sp.]
MSIDLTQGWLVWAIVAAIAVPVLLVLLTEIIGALSRRGHGAVKPLRLLRNWVVPVGALFALLAIASRSEADQVWPRVVATILGFLLILLLLSAFNVALFSHAREGSWRERVPSIFIEIARLILVVVGLGFLFQWVWGADVGGLVAALGVTSIVIGLALQNAVGGVISGLLLLFEQPFKIGDWLDIGGGTEGRVVQVNWRAVHIDTGSGIQIVPNSTLSGASFTNKSLPLGAFYVTVPATFSTDDPPHEVTRLLADVAESLPLRAVGEQADAEYRGAGKYEVILPVVSAAVAPQTVSLYLSWLWYAARRAGLALDGDATDPIADPAFIEHALDVVGPTLHAGPDDRELVAHSAKLERYGAGETVSPAGQVPQMIRFVVDGRIGVLSDAAGGRLDIADVEPGDYVGDSALTREKASTIAIARSVTTVLAVPVDTIDRLVQSRPLLAREIGQSLEQKRRLAERALAEVGLAHGMLSGLAD